MIILLTRGNFILEPGDIDCAITPKERKLTSVEIEKFQPIAWRETKSKLGVFAYKAKFIGRLSNGTIQVMVIPTWPRRQDFTFNIFLSPTGQILKSYRIEDRM